jgi:ketosteroid isomerase-like protein
MEHNDVQAWLDRYVAAWRANSARLIEDLFTEDAVYRYRPYGGDDSAAVGRAQIVESWLEDPDEPDSWQADYRVFAVEGDRAVAVGSSHYRATGDDPERTFHNCFLIRFAGDGHCAEFTEYYMEQARLSGGLAGSVT